MEYYKQKLTEYKKRNGEPLTQKSQDQYYRTIKGLVEKNGYDWRIEKLKEHLKSFETPTQLSYVNAIINYLTIMNYIEPQISPYKKYKKELEVIKESKPIVNPKKENNLAEWSEILEWKNKVSEINKSKSNPQYNELMLEVLLHLYTTYPRRNEIADLQFTERDPKNPISDNNINELIYINPVGKPDEFILKFVDYKTDGTYGTQIYHTGYNTDLTNLLKAFISKNNFKEQLFNSPKDMDKPLTRLNLTKMLQRSSKKHIGKSVSTDRIRKAYAGQNKEAIAKIENTANMLSHSVGTNMKHYNVKK